MSAPDADGYDVGDSITIDLSSLDFSTTEVPAAFVDVSLGGVSLGTHAVDRTLQVANDEIGRASVTTAIPAGLYGTQDLVVSVPTTGTTATLAVDLNKAPTTTKAIVLPGTTRPGHTVWVLAKVTGPLPIDGTLTVYLDGVAVGEYDAATRRPWMWTIARVKLPNDISVGDHSIDVVYNGTDVLAMSEKHLTIKVKASHRGWGR